LFCKCNIVWNKLFDVFERVTDTGLEGALRDVWGRRAWKKVGEWLRKWTDEGWSYKRNGLCVDIDQNRKVLRGIDEDDPFRARKSPPKSSV
jgi:hypothetical protein